MISTHTRKWLGRILIAIVFFINIQCAILFILWPGNYASGFELSGIVGGAYVRGTGLLFLMWNVPYAVALFDPVRHRVSLFEAIVMQSIGLLGETIILLTLGGSHTILASSLSRFILFDGMGLVLLVMAAIVTRPSTNLNSGPAP
jgi:hypothetical protein